MSTPHFKRAAPFTPTGITGCQLWLDANDKATMTLSASTVTQINDKSGNGNNTSSSTGTVSYAATGLNGFPAFSFNATGGFRGPTSITGTTLTAFTVATLNSGVNYNGRLLGLANATQNDYAYATTCETFFCRNGGPNISGYRNNTYMGYATNTFDTPFIGTAQFTGSSNITSLNGTPGTAAADANGSFSITKYGFGCEGLSDAGVNWYGYCSEIILYNSLLSGPQQQQVEAYLAQKWGLKSIFPSGHPALTSIIYPSRTSISAIPRTYPSLGISRPVFITQLYPTASTKIVNRPTPIAFASTTVIVTNVTITYLSPNYTITGTWTALSGADTYNVTITDVTVSYVIYTTTTASTTTSKVTGLVGSMANGDTIRVSVYGINSSSSTNSLTGSNTAILSVGA